MTEQLTDRLDGPAGEPTEEPSREPTGPTSSTEPHGPIRVAWAPVPRVNLLPIEVLEARSFRRIQLILAGVLVGTVTVAGGGTIWAQSGVRDANEQLVSAQAEVVAIQAEQAKYAVVPEVIAAVDAAKTARTTAMSRDVLWYVYLNNLAGAQPDGVKLTSITATVSAPSTATETTATDPLTASGIGALALSGSAQEYSQVSALIDALDKVPGLASATLTNATRDDTGAVTFSLNVTPTTDALSKRYDQKAG